MTDDKTTESVADELGDFNDPNDDSRSTNTKDDEYSDVPKTEVPDNLKEAARPAVDNDAEVTTEVHMDAGVRIRTNIQAGGSSERANVTTELHGETLGDIVAQLDTYRKVTGEQIEWARIRAKEANSQ